MMAIIVRMGVAMAVTMIVIQIVVVSVVMVTVGHDRVHIAHVVQCACGYITSSGWGSPGMYGHMVDIQRARNRAVS